MAVYSKADLKALRASVITSNGVGNITGTNLGGFTDDFIDSIWDYADNSVGSADLKNLEIINDFPSRLRDKTNTNSYTQYGFHTTINSRQGTGSNLVLNCGTSTGIISTNGFRTMINTSELETYNSKVYISSTNDVTVSANGNIFGISQNALVWGTLGASADIFGNSVKLQISGNIFNPLITVLDATEAKISIKNDLEVDGHIKGYYKSADGSLGVTGSFIVQDPKLNKTITIKDGIVTNLVNFSGWTAQIDIFDSVTSNPIPGISVKFFANTGYPPPVGSPFFEEITNSIGRVIVTVNPNSIYMLHLSGGIYDDDYPVININSPSKLINLSLDPTG